MRAEEFLTEIRSNPVRNTKLSRDEQLRHIVEQYGTGDIYATFTQINKFGINVKSLYNTPTGIYAYPIDYIISKGAKNVPFAGKSPYIQIFKNNTPLENTWILSDKLNSEITERIINVLEIETGQPCPTFKNNKSIWEYIYKFIMGKNFKSYDDWADNDNYHIDVNNRKPSEYAPKARKVLLNAEIYAIIDNGKGIIYPDEPTQGLFLKIEYLDHLATIVGGQSVDKNIDPSKIKKPSDLAAIYKNISAEDAFNKASKKKGRSPELESSIMKNPHLAYVYAMNNIRGRWPEAEKYIITDPAAARNYSVFVLQKRWPEAEPMIFSDNKYKKLYKSDFGIK